MNTFDAYPPQELTEDGFGPFKVGIPEADGVSQEAADELSKYGNAVQIVDPPEAQGLITRGVTKGKTADQMARLPNTMHWVRAGVGVDNIDLKLAAATGRIVVNTPGGTTQSVARRALAFLLNWEMKLRDGHNTLKDGMWPSKDDASFDSHDTSAMNLGILGYGRIGRDFKRMVEAVGLPFGRVHFFDVADIQGKTELEAMLRVCRVISVHVAGAAEVLTPELLGLMPKDAFLINTARGAVVNTKAVRRLMDEGLQYATDVFEYEEPDMFKKQPALLEIVRHPNCVGASPHRAAASPDAQRKVAREAADLTAKFALKGMVNPNDGFGFPMKRVEPYPPDTEMITSMVMHGKQQGDELKALLSCRHGIAPNRMRTFAGLENLAMTTIDHDPDAERVLKCIADVRKEFATLRDRSFKVPKGYRPAGDFMA